jgi:hypothetical protein
MSMLEANNDTMVESIGLASTVPHEGASRRTAALLEHDSVLAAARSGANGDESASTASSRDFAVGQIVLVNNMQFQSISDQLIARSDKRRVIEARQESFDAHG